MKKYFILFIFLILILILLCGCKLKDDNNLKKHNVTTRIICFPTGNGRIMPIVIPVIED